MATKKTPPARGTDTPAPPRPAPPPEVDASRVAPRPVGPFKGGIILNTAGRCAVCDGVGDHVHTMAAPSGDVTEHAHRDAEAAALEALDVHVTVDGVEIPSTIEQTDNAS